MIISQLHPAAPRFGKAGALFIQTNQNLQTVINKAAILPDSCYLCPDKMNGHEV